MLGLDALVGRAPGRAGAGLTRLTKASDLGVLRRAHIRAPLLPGDVLLGRTDEDITGPDPRLQQFDGFCPRWLSGTRSS